jgi:ribosomal protein L40E
MRESDIESMRSKITSLYSEIANMKNKIGEYYWHVFSISGQYDPAIGEFFRDIGRRVEEIADLEREIQIIEDGTDNPIQPPITVQLDFIVCGFCGAQNAGNAKFCESCGAKLNKEMTLEEGEEILEVCPLCGASLPDDAIFCYTCGARVTI